MKKPDQQPINKILESLPEEARKRIEPMLKGGSAKDFLQTLKQLQGQLNIMVEKMEGKE